MANPPISNKLLSWFPGSTVLVNISIFPLLNASSLDSLDIVQNHNLNIDDVITASELTDLHLTSKSSVNINSIFTNTDLSLVVFSIAKGAVQIDCEGSILNVYFIGRPSDAPASDILIQNIYNNAYIESLDFSN